MRKIQRDPQSCLITPRNSAQARRRKMFDMLARCKYCGGLHCCVPHRLLHESIFHGWTTKLGEVQVTGLKAWVQTTPSVPANRVKATRYPFLCLHCHIKVRSEVDLEKLMCRGPVASAQCRWVLSLLETEKRIGAEEIDQSPLSFESWTGFYSSSVNSSPTQIKNRFTVMKRNAKSLMKSERADEYITKSSRLMYDENRITGDFELENQESSAKGKSDLKRGERAIVKAEMGNDVVVAEEDSQDGGSERSEDQTLALRNKNDSNVVVRMEKKDQMMNSMMDGKDRSDCEDAVLDELFTSCDSPSSGHLPEKMESKRKEMASSEVVGDFVLNSERKSDEKSHLGSLTSLLSATWVKAKRLVSSPGSVFYFGENVSGSKPKKMKLCNGNCNGCEDCQEIVRPVRRRRLYDIKPRSPLMRMQKQSD